MTTIQTREATKANDDPSDKIVNDGEEKVAVRMRPLWRRMLLTEK